MFDFISEKEALSEEEASDFIQQILLGLKHMHSKHIAHLDLKVDDFITSFDYDAKVFNFSSRRT